MFRSYCEKNPATRSCGSAVCAGAGGTAAIAVSWPVAPGVGLSTMLQPEPSQCSASVRCWWPVCTLSYVPTAQTLLGETATTLLSHCVASPASRGFGLGTSVHVEPSQCSVNVDSCEPRPRLDPTAHAFVGDSALTESR